jgi:hypothetical protein
MKSIIQFLFVTIFLALSVSIAFSQNETSSQEKNKEQLKTKNAVQIKTQEKQQEQVIQNKQQIIHGFHFIDNDKDGYNDNAPDHDNDGIPNGQDPDYQGAGKGQKQQGFVDNDGDGIADNTGQGRRAGRGYRYGIGNETGKYRVQPLNGRGYGAGATSGQCDGTGPKGKRYNGSR